MKLNISSLPTCCQKVIEVDEWKHHTFYGHRSSCWHSGWRVEGLCVQNQGWEQHARFFLKRGVLARGRVHLLFTKGRSYRLRRTGERKGKTVWGCIVNANLSILNLGGGLGSRTFLGLKMLLCPEDGAQKRIWKLFSVSKGGDVCQCKQRR